MMATGGIETTQASSAGRRWLGWMLLSILGAAVILGAGWAGYRGGFDGDLPTPRPHANAASGPAGKSSYAVEEAPPVPSGPIASREGAAGSTDQTLRWPLWEFQLSQPIPPRNPPLTPAGWRLLGATMTREGWKVAILRQDSRQPELLGIGSSLPGGYVIKAISDEDVTFLIDKREVVLSYTGSR